MLTTKQQDIIRRSDVTIFGAMCALAYFLPISGALIEWSFAIGLIAFFIKRGTLYKAKHDQEILVTSSVNLSNLVKRIFLIMRCYRIKHNFLNKPIAFYLGIAFLSVATSYNPSSALNAFIFKLMQTAFTAFLVLESVSTKKRIKIFTSIFLISITLVLMNSFVQYTSGVGFLRGRELVFGRLVSSFKFANDYAAYLVMVIPITFSLSLLQMSALFGKRDVYHEKSDTSQFFSSRIFTVLVSLLFAGALISIGLTYSRGGWGAMVLALFFLLRHKPRVLTFFLVGVLAFGIYFVPKMVKERESNIAGDYKKILTVSSRNQTWKNASRIIFDHPILGVGLNNYSEVSQTYSFDRPEYPHNCYLQMAAEIGLTGLSVFLWMLYVLFKASMSYVGQIKERFFYYLQVGVLAGIAGFLIHSGMDTFFYSTQLGSLLWLMIGLVLANFNTILWHRRLPVEEELES